MSEFGPPHEYERGEVRILTGGHGAYRYGPYRYEIQLNGRTVAFTDSVESAQNIANQLGVNGYTED
jgi:hypothetical protein